jgi:uncharacterized protein
MTAETIDVAPGHQLIVIDILQKSLPSSTRVWVFGSRATGRARRYSDLDLAIDVGRRLTIDETAILREAFDECELPYRVDIVDWQAIDNRFRRLIDATRVPLVEIDAGRS